MGALHEKDGEKEKSFVCEAKHQDGKLPSKFIEHCQDETNNLK